MSVGSRIETKCSQVRIGARLFRFAVTALIYVGLFRSQNCFSAQLVSSLQYFPQSTVCVIQLGLVIPGNALAARCEHVDRSFCRSPLQDKRTNRLDSSNQVMLLCRRIMSHSLVSLLVMVAVALISYAIYEYHASDTCKTLIRDIQAHLACVSWRVSLGMSLS